MIRNKIYITGTSRGLGKALADYLLKDNNNIVVGIGRDCTIEANNYSHQTVDLSNKKGLNEIYFDNDENAEHLILINNAGTLGEIGPIGTLDAESITESMFLNLTAPMVLINTFINQFSSKSKLTIINISSGAAWNAYDGWAIYCASKAGLDMFAAVVHKENELQKKNNCRIFSISPGVIETNMQEQIRNSNVSKFSTIDKFRKLKEDGVLQKPDDVAQKIVQLINTPENFKNYKVDISDLKP